MHGVISSENSSRNQESPASGDNSWLEAFISGSRNARQRVAEPPTAQFRIHPQHEGVESGEPQKIGQGATVLEGYARSVSESFRRDALGTVHIALTVRGERLLVDHQLMHTLVGRHPVCDIRIRSEYASRMHANFVIRNDGFHLIDTSKNGTFVRTDAGSVIYLKRNWRFPMRGSGAISFGVPFQQAEDWLVQYVCRV